MLRLSDIKSEIKKSEQDIQYYLAIANNLRNSGYIKLPFQEDIYWEIKHRHSAGIILVKIMRFLAITLLFLSSFPFMISRILALGSELIAAVLYFLILIFFTFKGRKMFCLSNDCSFNDSPRKSAAIFLCKSIFDITIIVTSFYLFNISFSFFGGILFIQQKDYTHYILLFLYADVLVSLPHDLIFLFSCIYHLHLQKKVKLEYNEVIRKYKRKHEEELLHHSFLEAEYESVLNEYERIIQEESQKSIPDINLIKELIKCGYLPAQELLDKYEHPTYVRMKYNGYEYFGEVLEGLPHGSGMLKSENTFLYDGGFANGKKNGYGVQLFRGWIVDRLDQRNEYVNLQEECRQLRKRLENEPNEFTGIRLYDTPKTDLYYKISRKEALFLSNSEEVKWVGVFKNDKNWNGKGYIEFDNGDIYQGELKNGLRDGRGKTSYLNGKIWEGVYKDGKEYNGAGYMIINKSDGSTDTFEGTIVNGKRSGCGKYTHQNGGVFEGTYTSNGEADGKYTYPDGRMYARKLSNNKYIVSEEERIYNTSKNTVIESTALECLERQNLDVNNEVFEVGNSHSAQYDNPFSFDSDEPDIVYDLDCLSGVYFPVQGFEENYISSGEVDLPYEEPFSSGEVLGLDDTSPADWD